jgi:hypothetical protein
MSNLKGRVEKLERRNGNRGLFSGDWIIFSTRPGEDVEEAKQKAVREYEARHGREVRLDEVSFMHFRGVAGRRELRGE